MLFSIDFFGLVCLAPLFLIWEGDIYRLKTIILLKITTYIYVVRKIHEHSAQRCQSLYSSPNNHQWSPNQWAVFNQQNITAASMYIHILCKWKREQIDTNWDFRFLFAWRLRDNHLTLGSKKNKKVLHRRTSQFICCGSLATTLHWIGSLQQSTWWTNLR